jgi:large conductance mechanosensitive channel
MPVTVGGRYAMHVAREFREFILRGNALDLAIGVVFGVAFNAVITSLVNDVLLQVIAALVGQPNFSDIVVPLGSSSIRIGAFVDALINFLFVGLALFMIVKVANTVARARRGVGDDDGEPDEQTLLLREIRDALRETR